MITGKKGGGREFVKQRGEPLWQHSVQSPPPPVFLESIIDIYIIYNIY